MAAADYLALTKPRIAGLIAFTTAIGFCVASAPAPDLPLLGLTLAGTLLATAGAGAFNHYLERDVDGRMRRTSARPLPAGRLRPRDALRFAAGLSATGVAILAAFVGPITTLLVLASLASYTLLYTPLKRQTALCTPVGAIPGALPVVAGWTAAGATPDATVAFLFAVMLLWQMPHFLSLAWLYRDDYRAGGLAILTVNDREGRATGRVVFLATAALLPASLGPWWTGVAGTGYFAGALILGHAFLALAASLWRNPTPANARRLFLASLVYLPLLFLLLAADVFAG